jgi:D-threo-aldose 1-dehydrogenase
MASAPFGRFALGTANLGNLYAPVSDEQAHAVLEAAWECGIRYFDTAPHYGLGLAERRLGTFLSTKAREEFVISTKVGRRLVPNLDGAAGLDDANHFYVPADHWRVWDFSADGVRRSLDASLARLGLDSVDIVYLHDPDEYDLETALAEGLPAVAVLRDAGVVSAVGIGSKSVEALAAGARSGLLELLMVAGRFTLLEQPALDDVLPECRARLWASPPRACSTRACWQRGLRRNRPPMSTASCRRACSSRRVRSPPSSTSTCPPRRCTTRCGSRRCRRWSSAQAPEEVRQNERGLHATVPAELWTTLREKGLIRQ